MRALKGKRRWKCAPQRAGRINWRESLTQRALAVIWKITVMQLYIRRSAHWWRWIFHLYSWCDFYFRLEDNAFDKANGFAFNVVPTEVYICLSPKNRDSLKMRLSTLWNTFFSTVVRINSANITISQHISALKTHTPTLDECVAMFYSPILIYFQIKAPWSHVAWPFIFSLPENKSHKEIVFL